MLVNSVKEGVQFQVREVNPISTVKETQIVPTCSTHEIIETQ